MTGFIVEDEISAVAAVGRLVWQLDRGAIRGRSRETRFTARRMALDYVEAYRDLVEERRRRRSGW